MNGFSLNFTLPEIKKYGKNGQDWRIVYQFHGKRIQVKVNKVRDNFKTDKEAEKYLKEYIIYLTDLLRNGVDPYTKTTKTDLKLCDLLELYLAYYNSCNPLGNSDNKRLFKRLKDYETRASKLQEFIRKTNPCDYIVSEFTVAGAQNFFSCLQKYYQWSEARCRTYLGFLINAFKFAVGEKYCKDNPFEHVKIPQGLQKRVRRNVTEEEWLKIATNTRENNYNFYIFCNLVKHLARPNEILNIQKKHVDSNGKHILLPIEHTKTKKDRIIYIHSAFQSEFMNYLDKIEFSKLTDDTYLFGSHFKPAKTTIPSSSASIVWRNTCLALGIADDCELYGLKHAGIAEMANSGVPLNVIRLQAGHSTPIMTSHYANHISEKAIETLQNW